MYLLKAFLLFLTAENFAAAECLNGGIPEFGVCRCLNGYRGEVCADCSKNTTDLVFVVDESLSVSLSNETSFEEIQSFLVSVVDYLPIDQSNAHVGMVSFSNDAYLEFYLNSFTSKDDLIVRINNAKYKPGGTATAPALRMVKNEIFNETLGARNDSLKVVILVTDGIANRGGNPVDPAKELKDAGVTIIAVGIGAQLEVSYLEAIASGPDLIFHHQSLAQVSDKLKLILTC